MSKPKSFTIVGGGIGGLTTAIALIQKGYSVKIFESATEFHAIGAGIVLSGNAMKAYRMLGMYEQVVAAGRVLSRFALKDSSGRYLTRAVVQKDEADTESVNTLAMHRADLQRLLVTALPPETVVYSKRCVGFVQNDESIRLYFDDGTSSDQSSVIAADGLHSTFRKKLIPETDLRYSGCTCWRAVVSHPSSASMIEAAEFWGRGLRFGVVPLCDQRVYWYATQNQQPKAQKKSVAELESLFAGFESPVKEVIACTSPVSLISTDIYDFKPVRRYAFGNIVLVGDAAHATTPNLGQGACMAIEDAVVLASCIAAAPTVESAFRLFESRRIKRTQTIVKTSYRLGKVAQLSNPLLVTLRDTAMRLTPAGVAARQVRYLNNVSLAV